MFFLCLPDVVAVSLEDAPNFVLGRPHFDSPQNVFGDASEAPFEQTVVRHPPHCGEEGEASRLPVGVDLVALGELGALVKGVPGLEQFGLPFEEVDAFPDDSAFDHFATVLIVIHVRRLYQLQSQIYSP